MGNDMRGKETVLDLDCGSNYFWRNYTKAKDLRSFGPRSTFLDVKLVQRLPNPEMQILVILVKFLVVVNLLSGHTLTRKGFINFIYNIRKKNHLHK